MRNEISRYDLFSPTVRLKAALSKRTFFCFSAAFVCNVWKRCRLFGIWT